MSKAGILPGEHALASTMEAFAKAGDVGQVLALVEVRMNLAPHVCKHISFTIGGSFAVANCDPAAR